MSFSRYSSLIRLWLRLKRWIRDVLVKGFTLTKLNALYKIANDWMDVSRAKVSDPTIQRTSQSPSPNQSPKVEPPIESSSGQQHGVDPANDTKPKKYRLY